MTEERDADDRPVMMTDYRIVVEDGAETFHHGFPGEPQVNLTFEHDGHVYRVTSRAHDEEEGGGEPTFHASRA